MIGALGFGAGLFSWLALESVILHRLLVHDALAIPLLPTLGIQLAPPVVGCVAYLSLTTGSPDNFALALLGYGLLQALLLVRVAPRLRAQPFAAPYWAFTFGASALALAPIRMVQRGAELDWLAIALFVAANLVVGSVALGTLHLAVRGRLLAPAQPGSTGTMREVPPAVGPRPRPARLRDPDADHRSRRAVGEVDRPALPRLRPTSPLHFPGSGAKQTAWKKEATSHPSNR
jgi:hypothetical protein